jgi:hypothetical protein
MNDDENEMMTTSMEANQTCATTDTSKNVVVVVMIHS